MDRQLKVFVLFLVSALLSLTACSTVNVDSERALAQGDQFSAELTSEFPTLTPETPMLTPDVPARTPVGQVPQHDSIPEFEAVLIQAIETHDWAKMQSLMGDSFVLAFWQSEGLTLSPGEAIDGPYAPVSVAVGPANSESGEVARGKTNADGVLVVQVPAQGAPGMDLVFAVSAEGRPGVFSPDLFHITAVPEPLVTVWPLSGPSGTLVQVTARATPTPAPVLTPTPTPYTDMWTTYSSPVFAISLQYPADWQPIPGYGSSETGDTRYGAINGFFQVSAMDSDSIDAAAAAEAEHKLQSYGSQPTIETLQVQGQEARLILPSNDQPTGMQHQAALIVRYPEPVNITGTPCRYFVLWADWPHIRAIGQTLRFTR